MEFKAGDKLCNCTLIQKSGDGAYGEVWLAEDIIGSRVAVKILHGKYSDREVAGLKRYKDCNHPNLLKIRYVEINEKGVCYTMDAADDLNEGPGDYQPDTLANRLNKFGRLEGEEIAALVEDLLSGLEELHKHGLVHRDIKPDNILWVNGRATLADVGLIANDGANSLAGTPGFLSPQVLEGNPAEARDDFYALGKVIYCAMTGLDAKEYPSLPADMTISVDANLNRAVRESCSHPVSSAAEFRKLLAEKKTGSEKKHFPWKMLLKIILVVSGFAGVLCWISASKQNAVQSAMQETGKHSANQPVQIDSAAEKRFDDSQNAEADFQNKQHSIEQRLNKMEKMHIVQPVPIDPEDEEKLKLLQNVDKDAAEDLQKTITSLFERLGFFTDNGKLLPVLLNYELLTTIQMRDLLWFSDRNPRIVPSAGVPPRTSKNLSAVEQQLFSILINYIPEFDAKAVKARQLLWRKKTGNPQQLQKAMLTSDLIMQAVALDAVIRSGLNSILRNNKLSDNDKKELEYLLKLRYYLLTPEIYKLEYLSKKLKH